VAAFFYSFNVIYSSSQDCQPFQSMGHTGKSQMSTLMLKKAVFNLFVSLTSSQFHLSLPKTCFLPGQMCKSKMLILIIQMRNMVTIPSSSWV